MLKYEEIPISCCKYTFVSFPLQTKTKFDETLG